MNFEKMIAEALEKVDKAKADIAALIGVAEAEERELSDDEDIQLQALYEDVETFTKRAGSLEKAEKALGMKVVKANDKPRAPGIISQRGSKDRPKGDLIFKMATAQFLASQKKMQLMEAGEKYYGHDEDLQTVIKSAVNPAATDVTGWAAELVDESLQGFLDILRAESVGWDLLAQAGISLQFDQYGAITVPSRVGTDTDMASGFTGERDALPVKRATLAPIKIYPYKWGVISTFSKELAMRSTPSIEALIRQMIIADTGTQLDHDLFGEDALVTGYRPAGLMNGVTGTAAATGGTDAENMNTDIKNLIKPLISGNSTARPIIYLNPSNALEMASVLTATGQYLFRDDLSQGVLFTVPVRQSNNIPVDEHQIIDAASLAASVGAPMFTVSDTATIVEMDDDGVQPTMSANYPRSPVTGQVGDAARDTVNTPAVRSLFQTETVAVKNVQFLSWQMMRSESVNRITGVAYGS